MEGDRVLLPITAFLRAEKDSQKISTSVDLGLNGLQYCNYRGIC
jgi:hypothetical protein